MTRAALNYTQDMALMDIDTSSPAQRGHLKISSDARGWEELRSNIQEAGIRYLEVDSPARLSLILNLLRLEDRAGMESVPSFLRVGEAVIRAHDRLSGGRHIQTANLLRNARCCLLMECAPESTWDPAQTFRAHLRHAGRAWSAATFSERSKKVRSGHRGSVLRFTRERRH